MRLDALAALRTRGIAAFAYTNGTFFPPAQYYPRLADAGLTFDAGTILTPATVAAHRLAAMGMRRVMVMGAGGTTGPLTDMGIETVPPAPHVGAVDAVLLGYTRDFGATALESVVQAVWDGAPCFAGSVAPYFAGQNGRY